MIKLKFNRATTWIGFILINMLAISCGCGETPEEKQKKELVAEEKKLMDKLKQHFKPEAWATIAEGIKKEKNDLGKVDEEIKSIKYIIGLIEQYESGNFWPTIGERILLARYLDALGIENFDEADLAKGKQAANDALKLYENFKQQLELKNKGKKTSNKRRPRG